MSKLTRKYRNIAVIWFLGAVLLSVLSIFSGNTTFLLVGCLYLVIGIIYVLAYRKAKKMEESQADNKKK